MPYPIVNPLGFIHYTSKISAPSLNWYSGYEIPRISKSRRHLLYLIIILLENKHSTAQQFYGKQENIRKNGTTTSSYGGKEEGGAALMCTDSLACESAQHLTTMWSTRRFDMLAVRGDHHWCLAYFQSPYGRDLIQVSARQNFCPQNWQTFHSCPWSTWI